MRSLRQLQRYGIPALFGGLGLLLSTLAHWPGTAAPTSDTWANVAGIIAIGLLTSGSVLFADTVRQLQGHWSVDACIPGLNVLSVNILIARRLGLNTLGSGPLLDGLTLVAACALFHQGPIAFLFLVALTRSYLLRVAFLLRSFEHAPELPA
jgi:hypothetical protein